MPTPALMELPKSQSSEEFESMCKDVLSESYSLKFKKFGRKGQPQGGIDLYAKKDNRNLIVAQCKNYLKVKSSKTLIAQICEDVASASKRDDIAEFIAVTAQDNDANVQNAIITSCKNIAFPIEVWFWEDVQEIIYNNKGLLNKYYPNYCDNTPIPIEIKNKLIDDLKILEDVAKNLYANFQNYRHAINSKNDVDLYNTCVYMFNTKRDMVDIEREYHLQLLDLGISESIDDLAKLLPDFCDEAQDGTGLTMFYTNTDYLNYFTSDKSNKFRKKCTKVIQKLEE